MPVSLRACGLALVLATSGACRGEEPQALAEALAPQVTRSSVQGPRVRVLGIAQDGGLPHAACTCERCEAARRDPARASDVASLGIIGAREVWMIDATPDLPEQLDRLADVRSLEADAVDRHPLEGILLTHGHMGHYLGLAHLGFEAVAAEGVEVHASASMAALLGEHAPWQQLVAHGEILVHVAEPERAIELEPGLRATPLLVPHRAEYTDTFAWRIEGGRASVLYVPDCDPWPKWTPALDEVLAGIDLLLVDGTFHSGDELPGRNLAEIGHPLMVDTMDVMQARVDAGELKVWFVHLNHSNPALDPASAQRRELERRGYRVAASGDEFEL